MHATHPRALLPTDGQSADQGAFFSDARWLLDGVVARQLLPRKNEVRRKERKRETSPRSRLVCPFAEILPSRYADHSHFKEHQRDSKASSKPYPRLLAGSIS